VKKVCVDLILHVLYLVVVCLTSSKCASQHNKLSPGGLRQFTLSPIRDDDRTQELGLTLLGRVPMLALYAHTHH